MRRSDVGLRKCLTTIADSAVYLCMTRAKWNLRKRACSPRGEAAVCCRAMSRISSRSVLAATLAAGAFVIASASAHQAAAATAHTCSSFIAARGPGYAFRATDVEYRGSLTCSNARRLIKIALGGPGSYKKVPVKTTHSYGQTIYYVRGGWRCQTLNGGAGCHNVNHNWFVGATIRAV